MKKKLILASVIIIGLLVLLCSIVRAETFYDNYYELSDKRGELQDELDNANREMKQIEIKMTKALEELNGLNDRIDNYEQDIYTLEVDLIQLYNNIINVEEKLSNLEKDYEIQRKNFETRLVVLYEAGETKYLDVLLKSNSLPDFISNYFLIAEIAAYDTELLDNIAREKLLIDEIKKILEEKRAELKLRKDSRERTVVALENTKVIRNEYVRKLTIEEIETQNKIDECKEEIERINAEILAISMISLGSDYVGGVLAWPTPGWTTITSRFGMRIHPIFNIPRPHTGMDIAIPTGGAIIAANDGVVIKSEYTVGYGNLIIIDHGGGVITAYGHGSQLVARVGDEVKRGDIIMKAGSTGLSTGPHLHFELRINGICVDPYPYVTSKGIEQEITYDEEGAAS